MSNEGTERGLAKATLHENGELFRAIFSQAAVGIAQIDLEGKLRLVNERYCEILGYTQAELLKTTVRDITHPDDFDAAADGRRRLLAGMTASHSMEKRYLHKSGTIVWTRWHLSLVRDQDNLPQYFISVIQDVTEKVAAEEALRQSEALNKQVFDNIPECIFVLDVTSDGRFKFAGFNPAEEKAVGFSSAAVSGKFVEDVLAPEVAAKVIAHYRSCLEAGRLISYEDELDLPAGRRYFHTNLIPLRNKAGRIHRIAGCCTELTEVRRTQEEALARQKLESIGMLAQGIAHDFNNLLGGILASTELAMTECAGNPPIEEELQRIRTVSIRGSEIVRQLMIYSGKEKPDFIPVDLSALVNEMLDLLKVSTSKQVVLNMALRRDLPAVRANPAQIRQVLMNLITNASEAIGDQKGLIRVSTALVRVNGNSTVGDAAANLPWGDYISLEVSDTGNGMTREVQASVFDPFFTTKEVGRGLGLPVVQGIVRAHGGGIHFVSALGEGTTFQVLLPCSEKTPQENPVSPTLDATLLPGVGTILVVEDEDALRSAVSRMLEKAGFSVIEAYDGQSAISSLRSQKDAVDLVLLDVTLLGQISSREVAEEAQSLPIAPKIILTSAYPQENVDTSLAGLRVGRFIRKPFQFSDLLRLIQDTLSA